MTYAGRAQRRERVNGVSGAQAYSDAAARVIGTLRFDPTKLEPSTVQHPRTIVFQVEASVGAVGINAAFNLVRASDGMLIASTNLTSTAAAETGPETLTSASLSLGGAGNLSTTDDLYEVQMQRVGGLVTDVVTCLRAALVVTWTLARWERRRRPW